MLSVIASVLALYIVLRLVWPLRLPLAVRVLLSLLVFAFLIGPFGVVAATVALVFVGALAGRDSRLLEVVAAAVFLVVLTLAIFVWGVGLPIPVWPEW